MREAADHEHARAVFERVERALGDAGKARRREILARHALERQARGREAAVGGSISAMSSWSSV